jgi:hypothetical protein
MRRAMGWATAALLVLLTGCAGTIKQDARVTGDVSHLEGVAQVVALLSPDAAKLQVDNPQFSREELATRLRNRLEAKGLTAPSATHRVQIEVTDIRVRSAFSAIMFGVMAGDDHVTGRVHVIDPAGHALRSFEIHTSYAFGGVAGGQDGMRMNWLYDKFADLATAELEKVIAPPRVATGQVTPIASTSVQPAPASPPVAAVALAPGTPMAIDNVEAVPVSERGRAVYRDWLKHKNPRAFIVSENGWYYWAWSTKPVDPMDPTDPTERAMKHCQDAARPNCTPYAIDDRVVYTRPATTAAR